MRLSADARSTDLGTKAQPAPPRMMNNSRSRASLPIKSVLLVPRVPAAQIPPDVQRPPKLRLHDVPLGVGPGVAGDGADEEVHLEPGEEEREAGDLLFNDLHGTFFAQRKPTAAER